MRPGEIEGLGAFLKSRPEVSFVAATTGPSQMMAHVALHPGDAPGLTTSEQGERGARAANDDGLGSGRDATNLMGFVDGLTGWGIERVEVTPMGLTMKRHQR